MANTIARATGHDSSRSKETTRLGSKSAQVQAATWRTFVDADVWADGTVRLSVKRDGAIVHTFNLGPEA